MQEIYNDLNTVLLIHQWPHTPAQKPTPNKAKRNPSIFLRFLHFFSLFFVFFSFFFTFFCFFSLTFHFASIFSLNFRLFYLRFRFRFLAFRIEVNHVKSGFFLLPSETKFLLQFQISLPKRKWGRTLTPPLSCVRTATGTHKVSL